MVLQVVERAKDIYHDYKVEVASLAITVAICSFVWHFVGVIVETILG